MKKVSMDDLEQVTGGGALEEYYNKLEGLGVDYAEVAKMPRKKAVEYMMETALENGLGQYIMYTNAIYDII